jgi:TRAP-type C4-dicarboxylate transport system permease small subunit
MRQRSRSVLARSAELIGALLFALMFASFVLQVVSRYVFNAPIGWTLEACLVSYLWLVFWSCAFMIGSREHVSFSMLFDAVPEGGRRGLLLASSLATLVLFLWALPGTVDWILFMRIESTSDLHLRLDLLFSIFAIFMAAVVLRAAVAAWRLLGRRWRGAL